MPVSQFSSVQTAPGAAAAATVTSTVPLNFSGQVIQGGAGVMAQPSVFTVGGWFRLLAVGAAGQLIAADDQFSIDVNGSGTVTAGFADGGGTSVSSDIDVTDTQWHFVACSFLQDGESATTGMLSLYLDGSATAAGLVTGSTNAANGSLSIGVGGEGTLDIVSWCFWSTPLSTDELDVPFWGEPTGGVPADGLLAAFDFAGGQAVDVSPGGTGTVSASQLTWHTPSLQLTGGSVTAGQDDLTPGGSGPFSLLTWVDVPTYGTQPVVTSGTQSAGLQISVSQSQATVNFSNVGTLTPALTSGWHHLAVTFDGTTATAYVDGQNQASGQVTPAALTAQAFVVGADLENNQADDLSLQALSVWTTALAESDVLSYMTGALPFGVEGCAGFFPFTDQSEDGLGNALTFTAATASGGAVVGEVDTVIAAAAIDLDATSGTGGTTVATPSATDQSVAEGPALMRLRDLRALAGALPDEALPDLDDPLVTSAQEWYESFVASLPQPLADRLRAEFTDNLRKGMALADSGSLAGRYEVRNEDGQTVAYYHGPDGPEEVGRTDGTLSPYLLWVATIFMDIAGIIAAMFGILTTAAKITKAAGLFDDLYPAVGAAAANVPANVTATQRATTAIWNVLQVLWEWKAIGTLIWNIIKASWWSVAFTVASVVAQIVALIASGGWLLAVKVAQMAIAIGNLVKDLLQMPSSDGDAAPGSPAGSTA